MAAMRKDVAFDGSLGNKMATPVRPSYVSKVTIAHPKSDIQAGFEAPDTPVPDYEDDMPGFGSSSQSTSQQRNSFKFVNNFQHIISNIRTIEDHYSNLPEPDPDYLNDDDDDSYSGNAHNNHHYSAWKKLPHTNGAGASDDTSGDFPPPPPPLTAEELASAVSEAYEAQVQNGISPTAADSSKDGPPQIRPKPLHNPCLESKERQALHRELISNYKLGKDILEKPELEKVMRERRETQRKKEWEGQRSNKGRTSLEVKLEERRIKEEEEAKMKVIEEDESSAPELLRMHKKITHKMAAEKS